jgi:hypothetical protein
MRFALVVEPESADHLDRLVPLRSAILRAGFNVVRLRAGATLRRDLARAVEVTEKEDAALVYVAGDVMMADGGIALSSVPPMPVAELTGILCSRPLAQLLFMFDARAQGDAGDSFNALEHLEAIVRAIAPREHAVELLAAVESGPPTGTPALALTRFFVSAIDDPASLDPQGTLHMSAAYPKLTGRPTSWWSPPWPSGCRSLRRRALRCRRRARERGRGRSCRCRPSSRSSPRPSGRTPAGSSTTRSRRIARR